MKIKRDEDEAQINMTPMIDCVFQLLIFFMLVADMSNLASDREISLPYADKSVDITGKEQVIVNVRRDGSFWIADEQRSEEQLKQILKQEGAREMGADGVSERELLIRADEYGRWEHVQKVMWHAQDAGIYKIKLGGKREPK